MFFTGSPRIYRAQLRIDKRLDADKVLLRHPICFLFQNYSFGASLSNNNDEWTAFSTVFESFLQRLVFKSKIDDRSLFEIAYSLAFQISSMEQLAIEEEDSGSSQLVHPLMVDELTQLSIIGEKLLTAQLLGFRAEQQEILSVEKTKLQAAAKDQLPLLKRDKLPLEIELLTKLRWLEFATVDELLQQLVTGVLSRTLPTLAKPDGNTLRWRKVPILIFAGYDDDLQSFAIKLREARDHDLPLSTEIDAVRAKALVYPTKYVALLLDSLILASFGE